MTKYSEIEIETAKNMLKEGYTWIARDESGGLFAYIDKPSKLDTFWCSDGYISQVCKEFVPIFQNVRFGDKEPISLESIVPPILDDAEKRYLSAVIRPFRDRVKYIEKIDCACEEYIYIQVNRDWTILPRFKGGTMYKGMEPGHKYTLEELGI